MEQGLAQAFPDAKVSRSTVYLSDEQRAAIAKLSGKPCKRGMVYPYLAHKDGKLVGVTYLDRHRVRSKQETLLVSVMADGSLGKIQVITFTEPKQYLPRKHWYKQFSGKVLDGSLRLRRGVDGVSGATLTAIATTQAARRILAIHKVISPSLK